MKPVAGLLIAAALFAIPGHAAAAEAQQSVLDLVNDTRIVYGADRLHWNDQLQRSAQAKAQDMCDHNYFAHVSPDGVYFAHFIQDQKYAYDVIGENLAKGFDDGVAAVEGWKKSPRHFAAMINNQYTQTGVGYVDCATNGTKYFVQHFGAPETPAPPAPEPEVIDSRSWHDDIPPAVAGLAIGGAIVNMIYMRKGKAAK